MNQEEQKEDNIYINEIIRVTYKCNWKCKFCNVLKTNNFGENDVSSKEIILQILNLSKKYTIFQRRKLILSFSGGEPTLDKTLLNYIRLAKKIGVGVVEIQTNGTKLFKNKEYIHELIEAGLNEIFLAQHSGDEEVNKELGVYYKIDDFIEWTKYILDNKIHKKIQISFNIVVNKINLMHVFRYIKFLKKINFLDLLPVENNNGFLDTKRISFGLVQPNGYAEINKNEVLLSYSKEEIEEIKRIIELCKGNSIYPDFHFTAPPLCILDFPEYNLEHQRLIKLNEDKKSGIVNEGNLESYKILWKEKIKFQKCNNCKNSDLCLGFYKNWVLFVGEDYIKEIIDNYIIDKQ